MLSAHPVTHQIQQILHLSLQTRNTTFSDHTSSISTENVYEFYVVCE
jgi:hypothetical protein